MQFILKKSHTVFYGRFPVSYRFIITVFPTVFEPIIVFCFNKVVQLGNIVFQCFRIFRKFFERRNIAGNRNWYGNFIFRGTIRSQFLFLYSFTLRYGFLYGFLLLEIVFLGLSKEGKIGEYTVIIL